MEYILVALLIVNIGLATGVAESILYASAVPYPYYALTYSYTRPPVVLSYPLSLNFEETLAAALPSPVITGTGTTSLEDIPSIVNDGQLQEIPSNQSPPEALGEAAPAIASETETKTATEFESPYPGAPPQQPAALGEPAPSSPASDELKYPSPPVTYTVLTPIATQFHRQDELGQYNYGYANEHSSKEELKLLDGTTRGAYNYIDAEGKLQTVSYVSTDGEGFRVAATNLPQPIVPVEIPDSPEVAAAKAAHLQAKVEAVAEVNRAIAADAVAAAVSAGSGEDCK